MDPHMMRRGSDKVRYNGDSENFLRGSRARASMPITRPNNQSRERPMGVLFLQVGNDTRKAVMPNVLTSLDTVRALFVRTFPERLSMAALNSPDARLYILDEGIATFRPLDNHWDVLDQSVLKLCFRSSSHAVLGSSTQKHDFPNSGELSDDMLWQNAPGYQTLFSKDSTFSHQNKMFHSPHNANADWIGGEVSSPVSPGFSTTIMPPGGILERRDVRPNDGFLQRTGKPSRHQSNLRMNPKPGPADYRATAHPVWDGTATTSRHDWVETQGKRAGERTWRGPPNMAFDTTDYDGNNLQHGLQQMAMTLSSWMQARERDRAMIDWEMAQRRGDLGRSSFSSRSSMASNNETRNRMESLERQIGGLTDMLRQMISHGGLESCPERQATRPYLYPEERQGRRTRPEGYGTASDILHVPRAERAARPRQRVALFQLQEGIQHLRTELANLRHMQLKQQQACATLIHAGKHDLAVAVSSMMSKMARNDASRKERLQAETQRQRYAARAQTLSWQLSELEQAMRAMDGHMGENEEVLDAELRRNGRDLEHVHQVLGQLHDQYQNLQPRLCTLLRAEVEAMKFLKDEPHRLESLAKRTANVEGILHRFHGTLGFKESKERDKECAGDKEVSDLEQEERSITKYKNCVETCRQSKECTQNGTEHGGAFRGAVEIQVLKELHETVTKMSAEIHQKSSDDEDFAMLSSRTVPEIDSVQMFEGEMKDDETDTIIASDEDRSTENEEEDTRTFSSRSDSGKERPSSFTDVMDQESITDASRAIEIIDEHSAGDNAESNVANKLSVEYAEESIDGRSSDAVFKSTEVLDADMDSTVSTSSPTCSSTLPVECSFSPEHSPPQSHSPLHPSLSLSPSQSLDSLQSSAPSPDTCFSSTQTSVLSDPDTSSNADSSQFLPAASLEYSETVNVLHSLEPIETTSSTNLTSIEPFALNARSSSPDSDVQQPSITSNQTSTVDIEPTTLSYRPHLDFAYPTLTEGLPLMKKQTTETTTNLRILPHVPPPPTAEPPSLPGPPPSAIIKRSVLPPKRFVLPSKSFTARSLPNRAFLGMPPPPSRAPPPPSLPPPPPPPQTKLPPIPHYSSLHNKTEKSKEQEPLFKGERELVPSIRSPVLEEDGCEDVEKVAEQTKEQRQTEEEEEEMEEKLSDSLKHSDSLSSSSSNDSLSSEESSPASREWESLEDLNLESPYTVTKLAEPDRPQTLLEDVEPELEHECSEEKLSKLSASCDFSKSYGEKTCVDNDSNKSAEQQIKRMSDRRSITVRYIEEISPLATKGDDGYCEQEIEKEKLAFVIGEHRVQAMSHDEASRLVSEDDTLTKNMATPAEMGQVEDGDGESKEKSKQIVVFFDEPMDIRQAYKRLSTIFEDGEFEEDLRRMDNEGNSFQNYDFEERFEQQNELTMKHEVSRVEDANFVTEKTVDGSDGGGVNYALNETRLLAEMQPAPPPDRETSTKETSTKHPRTSNMESQRQVPLSGAEDHCGKSKYKIRFPRKQLVALTSALRSGSRSGKKTLELLVEGSGVHGRQTKSVPRSPYEDQINSPTADSQRNTSLTDGSELQVESGREMDVMASAEGCLHNENIGTCRKELNPAALSMQSEDEDLKSTEHSLLRSSPAVEQNGQSSPSDPESTSTQGHKGLRMLQNLTSSMWNTETRKRKA
uniref:sickle tail protein homolog n=1 Tax=Myxine glutinosa TaxID=7769 RepID=UPI00358FFA32